MIAIACVMYLIEFFADKVPYVDSGWDALHTFIRVPAGAILAARALGDMNPALELAAMLAGGSIALVAHGAKATTRLAINASPEPFSNWAASVTEDVAVFGGIWLIFNHPIIMVDFVIDFPRSGSLARAKDLSLGQTRLSSPARSTCAEQARSNRAQRWTRRRQS